jgi:hypothetical protein
VAGHEPPAVEIENLTESVGRLTDRLQVVWGTLDAIRIDLDWLMRNPMGIGKKRGRSSLICGVVAGRLP